MREAALGFDRVATCEADVTWRATLPKSSVAGVTVGDSRGKVPVRYTASVLPVDSVICRVALLNPYP